jgi:Novel STAND NTPase 1
MAKKKTDNTNNNIDKNRPFLGLRSFEEKNKSQFGGRDQEINELFGLVEDNDLTVVYGTSGIGKTSLLKAGLMPKLREELYFPIYIRIDYSSSKPPLDQMRDLVYDTMKELDPNVTPIGSGILWEYLHDVNFFNGLFTPVLILDQFEEIFTLGKNNKGIKDFVIVLADLAQNRIPKVIKEKYKKEHKTVPSRYSKQSYRVVISLREDYLARLDELKNYITTILDYGFRVVQLTISQAMEAAIKPGKGLISETVAREIIRILPGVSQADIDVLKEQGDDSIKLKVEPFLLSLICDRLNEKRIEKGLNTITSELVVQFKVDDVIVSFYDETIKAYEENVDHAIQNELLDAEGYRKLHALKEFQSAYKISDDVVDALVSARIVRKENRNNVDYLELIHDVLAPVIKKKRDERLKEEQEALRKAELAKQEAEREAAILREKEEIKKRNKRRAAVIIPIVIIVAGVAILSSISVINNKNRVENMAESRDLLNNSKSELLFSLNRDQAAEQSLEAYKLFDKYMEPEAGDYIFEELYYKGMITSYHKLFRGRGKNIFEIDTTRSEKNLPKNKISTNPINPNNSISQNGNIKILENKKSISDVPSIGIGESPLSNSLGDNDDVAKDNVVSDNYQAMTTGIPNETYYLGSKLGKIKILKLKKDSVNYKIDSIYKSPDIRRVHSIAFNDNLLAIASTKNIIDIYDVIENKSYQKIDIRKILDTRSKQYIYSFGFTPNDELLILKKDKRTKKPSIIKWDIESEKLSNWDTIDNHHIWKWDDLLKNYAYDKLRSSNSKYLKLGGSALSIPEVDRHGKKMESFKDLFFISSSSDSKVAVGIRNGLVIIKGNECYEIENIKFGKIKFVKFNPTGEYLIMGNDRGQVYAVKFNFEKKAKDIIETVELSILHTSQIAYITFNPNDSSFGTANFATADVNGLVVKWIKDNNHWRTILIDYKMFDYESELGEVIGMSFSKKGEFLTVFHGDKDNTIIRWPASMNTLDSLMTKKIREIKDKRNRIDINTKTEKPSND